MVHPVQTYLSIIKRISHARPTQALSHPDEIRFAETSSISLGKQSSPRGRGREEVS